MCRIVETRSGFSFYGRLISTDISKENSYDKKRNYFCIAEMEVEIVEGLERLQKGHMKKPSVETDKSFGSWWRLAVIFLMIGAMLFVVLESKQTGYLIAQVILLFCALFFGYRFGPGTGAIAGSISGIVLTLISGEVAQMGIVCLLGIFSGAFRSLGKMASLTAYAAAAFGVGILYSPALLFQTMESVLAAGAVFLLLPDKLVIPSFRSSQMDDDEERTLAPIWQTAFEGAPGDGIRHLSQTFFQLSTMYREEELAEETREPDWHMRYLELRQLLSEQFLECAQMLQETFGQMQEKSELSGAIRGELEKQLSRAGVAAKRIYLTENKNGSVQLVMALCAKSARCVSMKLVCERIEEALKKRMVPCADQPLLVSSTPRWVRFEEDPPYFVLFGAASSCKNGNEVSGDSFSYMELSNAKKALLLCDGMGSGNVAGRESGSVTELAEFLCEAGYPPSLLIRIINSALMIQAKEHPVTIDLSVIDCANGICELTKSGASVTFLKRGDEVIQIGADTMPAGILQEYAPMEKMIRLKDGDLLILVSDGVLEGLSGYDKETVMCRFCESLTENNPKEIAKKILAFSGKAGGERDDRTVLVAGIWKK